MPNILLVAFAVGRGEKQSSDDCFSPVSAWGSNTALPWWGGHHPEHSSGDQGVKMRPSEEATPDWIEENGLVQPIHHLGYMGKMGRSPMTSLPFWSRKSDNLGKPIYMYFGELKKSLNLCLDAKGRCISVDVPHGAGAADSTPPFNPFHLTATASLSEGFLGAYGQVKINCSNKHELEVVTAIAMWTLGPKNLRISDEICIVVNPPELFSGPPYLNICLVQQITLIKWSDLSGWNKCNFPLLYPPSCLHSRPCFKHRKHRAARRNSAYHLVGDG